MMARSSLRPVSGATEALRSISASRLMPSGVISKIHENTSTTGRPMAAARTKTCRIQLGASITCSPKSAACRTTQAIRA